jgi:hypothetical protein
MGGDSAAVSGMDIQVCSNPKIFKIRDFVIGYTSSFRMGQLLQYNLDLPERSTESPGTDLEYLVAEFIPAVRKTLSIGGYTTIVNNNESGGVFLVAYKRKAYCVWHDFQIIRNDAGFVACGSGESYAIGALGVMDLLNGNPVEAVRKALEVAGRFSAAVRPPYYVIDDSL